jgi:DNA-binding transcriptional MerR regulator
MGSHHPIRKTVAPEPVIVPDKLYFRIGDVARLCDVPPYVLRFWETEFHQLKPNKGGTGQRLYRKRDVETALRIKSLLYDQGYTIPGARQVFKSEPAAEPTPIAAPEPAEPASGPQPIDFGTQIRQGAQRRDQLAELRAELNALAAMLGCSAHIPAESPLSRKLKPTRPRLVLENSQPPKLEPHSIPAIHLNQGDLFAAE